MCVPLSMGSVVLRDKGDSDFWYLVTEGPRGLGLMGTRLGPWGLRLRIGGWGYWGSIRAGCPWGMSVESIGTGSMGTEGPWGQDWVLQSLETSSWGPWGLGDWGHLLFVSGIIFCNAWCCSFFFPHEVYGLVF